MINKVNKPIKLDGAFNVRELGGYPTKDGRHTKNGVYLRGDGTQALSKADLEVLSDAGVSLVVDMRSPDEVSEYPSRFYSRDSVKYENVVMFDGLRMFLASRDMPESMGELYCLLLDNCREQYKRIFSFFLDNNGVSLFHCTAGKDRTGVVAMLLLEAAGVDSDLIIADYSTSESNMAGIFEKQHEQLRAEGIEVPPFVFGSRTEDMEETLKYLYSKYGSAKDYLMQCGLTTHEVNALVSRFVE